MKGAFDQGIGEHEIPLQHHSSRKHREDASSDEEQQDSRRGRSKLERWTSHKERDFFIKSKSSSALKFKDINRNSSGQVEAGKLPSEPLKPADTSALKFKDIDRNNSGPVEAGKLLGEPLKPADTGDSQRPLAEDRDVSDLEVKDADTKPVEDRHLDTVEKLKKRSERFKLPMPGEKDALAIKKMDSEALPSVKSGTPVESEIKQERPARKRRWISN